MKTICAVIATLLLVCRVFAQDPELTAAQRRQFAEIVPHLLDTLYVSPEKGKQLAETVRNSFASGRYDAAKTAAELAAAINADLEPANDRHLRMIVAPADVASPILTIADWKARTAASGGGPMMRTPNREEKRLTNFGVAAAEVLDGNVGYLRVREFVDSGEARAALASAMALLAHTDAMIVDVRNCPGGSASTVSYLASYFFGPEKRVLMSRYNRPTGRSMDSTTVDVDGKRRPDVDLYILTSERSGSACESCSFTLQQWGRAKTVGAKTAGAGNNNSVVNVGAGLRLSISTGSALHGKTGKGFEAIGVIPDVAAPADRALDVAHAEALRKLGRAAKSVSDPIAEVRRLERAWLDAYEKRDAEAMKRIVADDFVIVHGDGRTETKNDVLTMLARANAAGMPNAKFTTDDVQARAFGDTVILTGRVTMEMQRRDGTTSKRESRYTDAYARIGGRWQVVSSHQGASKPAT